MKKITFLGDIMCEPVMLRAAKKIDGTYDFDGVFAPVKSMLCGSDYVIGNLETPLAGAEAGYSDSLLVFNTPDEFAAAVQKMGVDLVVTANNHCFDRGVAGMERTIRVLDQIQLPHTGTFLSPEDRREAFYFTVGDTKVAVISYTYGSNYSSNHIALPEDQRWRVNLLKPQTEPYFVYKKPTQKASLKKRIVGKILSYVPEEKRFYIRKALRMEYNWPHADDYLNRETAEPFLCQLRRDIETARKQADLVILMPHVGGQFNICPGAFSEYVFDWAIESGCDGIVASHAHVVQRAEKRNGVPCYFSLGNFSMSPETVYLLHEHLPEYGLAVHFYVEQKKIVRTTFSIVVMTASKANGVEVWPIDRLYEQETNAARRDEIAAHAAQIYETVTGRALSGAPIRDEYCFDEDTDKVGTE